MGGFKTIFILKELLKREIKMGTFVLDAHVFIFDLSNKHVSQLLCQLRYRKFEGAKQEEN